MKTPEVVPPPAALAQENRLDVFRPLVQAKPHGPPDGGIAGKRMNGLGQAAVPA